MLRQHCFENLNLRRLLERSRKSVCSNLAVDLHFKAISTRNLGLSISLNAGYYPVDSSDFSNWKFQLPFPLSTQSNVLANESEWKLFSKPFRGFLVNNVKLSLINFSKIWNPNLNFQLENFDSNFWPLPLLEPLEVIVKRLVRLVEPQVSTNFPASNSIIQLDLTLPWFEVLAKLRLTADSRLSEYYSMSSLTGNVPGYPVGHYHRINWILSTWT